jgi:copper chaperone CopZ
MDELNPAPLMSSPIRPTEETVTLGVAGMTCDHCARRVEQALRNLPGVMEVTVVHAEALARVTFDNSQVNVSTMNAALLKSGYQPAPAPAH